MTDHASPFDPAAGSLDLDARLVAALERLSQVFRVLLWEESQARGLTPIQIRILEHLRHHPPALRRVGELARVFDLTPATISDAVTSLERKGLVTRARSAEDRRIWQLDPTSEGEAMTEAVRRWPDPLLQAIRTLPYGGREETLDTLLRLIDDLQRRGVITVARLCHSCRFFGEGEGPDSDRPHFCRLLERPLALADLRLDCPEYAPREESAFSAR